MSSFSKATRTALRWLSLALMLAGGVGAPEPSAAAARHRDRWAGVVSYVADGDSVHVRPLHGGQSVRIRIVGIDAPEICQRGGDTAREALRQRVLGQTVVVDGNRRDDYARLLARIHFEGEDVGKRMVLDGHAWSYRYRGRGGAYDPQQRLAESARRGIFADTKSAALSPAAFRQQYGSCRQ